VKYMPVTVQHDATTYRLFISVNRSTCFWSTHHQELISLYPSIWH